MTSSSGLKPTLASLRHTQAIAPVRQSADTAGVNLVHVARLSTGGFACTDWMLAHPDESFTRDGWTAGIAVEHGDAHLSLADPDGATVVLSTRTPRGHGSVAAACACLPVHDLDALFDATHRLHDHAWECVPRLHAMTAALPSLGEPLTETDQRSILSWASLPPDVAATWQAIGSVSGASALALSLDGISPQQAEPFERMGWVNGGRWTRTDIACFVRHGLTAADARDWLSTHLPRRAVPPFIENGYTPAQARDLVQACREARGEQRPSPHDWLGVRPHLAASAVRAGLTPTEAAMPDLDLDAVTVLIALRHDFKRDDLSEAI